MLLKYIDFIWLGNLLLMWRWVWNAYSIIILPDNCGCGVICHCGMSRGHCCILGTTLSRVFWQLTTPLALKYACISYADQMGFFKVRSSEMSQLALRASFEYLCLWVTTMLWVYGRYIHFIYFSAGTVLTSESVLRLNVKFSRRKMVPAL